MDRFSGKPRAPCLRYANAWNDSNLFNPRSNLCLVIDLFFSAPTAVIKATLGSLLPGAIAPER